MCHISHVILFLYSKMHESKYVFVAAQIMYYHTECIWSLFGLY